MTSFDLDAYRAERIRRLEREVAYLRAHRAQLEALLATALRVAVARTTVDPLTLLGVLEEMERREAPAELAVRVLVETGA